MKRVPKIPRQKKADGGPVKKADVPKDASFVPNIQGYSTQAQQYVNEDGSTGFYYPKLTVTKHHDVPGLSPSNDSGETSTATATGTSTDATPVTPAPAVVKTTTTPVTPAVPAKPALTRDQQRAAGLGGNHLGVGAVAGC